MRSLVTETGPHLPLPAYLPMPANLPMPAHAGRRRAVQRRRLLPDGLGPGAAAGERSLWNSEKCRG